MPRNKSVSYLTEVKPDNNYQGPSSDPSPTPRVPSVQIRMPLNSLIQIEKDLRVSVQTFNECIGFVTELRGSRRSRGLDDPVVSQADDRRIKALIRGRIKLLNSLINHSEEPC